MEPLFSPSNFVGIENMAHLCTGGEAPWLSAQASVYEKFAQYKSDGYDGRQKIYAEGEECRNKMGQLWHVDGQRVSFMPSAAEGMSWVARGIDWRSGDNIVTTSLEFPSVAYAWRDLRARGVEVRMVDHQDYIVEESDLLAAVNARTRVMAVSQVSFYSGQNLRVERLADGLKREGALLAVDATHAAGAVDVRADLCDICVSSSYKWMLGTHGVAPFYLSERAELQVASSSYGWRNLAVWPAQGAERFPDVDERPMPERLEPGNPSMVSVLFLSRALDVLLGLGIERIEAHVLDLANEIASGLEARGLRVISPKARDRRSGNTCFSVSDARALMHALAEMQVQVWGEYGRVRISGHIYNSTADLERLWRALDTLER